MSEWISPTGHNDPDGKWTDEPLSYDEDPYDPSYTRHDTIYGAGTTSFIEWTHAGITCSKIRIYNRFSVGTINLDVYYSGAWHQVYYGLPTGNTWIEHELGGIYLVTKARFRHTHDGLGWVSSVNEFDFWGVGVPVFSVALVWAAAAAAVGAVLVIAGR